MAINFSVNDVLVVNRAFYSNVICRQAANPLTSQIIDSVGRLLGDTATVTATGTVVSNGSTLYYLKLVPGDTFSQLYNVGTGVVIYFPTETLLNNTFELSTAALDDQIFRLCLNSTGSTIPKGSIVRQTGYSGSVQRPIIALASAGAVSTNAVFGVADEDIADAASGSVIVEGSFQPLNTTGASVGDPVYLSDTPGAISLTAGTTLSAVGRVMSVATLGAVFVRGELFSTGGGGGSTGIQGLTGLASGPQGPTGVQGPTGIIGGTGVQGLGVTGLVGVTGLTGNTGLSGGGATGVAGVGTTGITGNTGLSGGGATGIAGITGLIGATGVGSGSGGGISQLGTYANIDPIAGTTEIAIYLADATTVITHVVLRQLSANGITIVPTIGIGFNASGADNVFTPVAITGVVAANDIWVFSLIAKAVQAGSGSTLLLGIDVATTGTTQLITADIFGYEPA